MTHPNDDTAPRGSGETLPPDLRARLASLSPERRTLLEERLRRQGGKALPSEDGPRGPAPLAPAQERLWLLDQLRPGDPAFHVTAAWRLLGPLDAPALIESFADVVRRHETLRTTVAVREGKPVAETTSDPVPELEVVDLAGEGGRFDEALREVSRQPFDLEKGPVVRARLFRCGPEDHTLHVSIHLFAADGWSLGVFAADLGQAYAARAAGRPPAWSALTKTYGDYARAQRAWMRGPAFESMRAWWRRALAGHTPPTVPARRMRADAGAVEAFTVPPDLSEALSAFSARHGVTRYMTLLAAFELVLFGLTGRTDALVWTPVAGRKEEWHERLVGLFVNPVPVRVDLSGDPSFLTLLDRVRASAVEAFARSETPFEVLMECIPPVRATGRAAMETSFAWHEAPSPLRLPGLRVERRDADPGGTQFDLGLTMKATPGGLAGKLRYRADLWSSAEARAIVGRYRDVLASAVEAPERKVSAFVETPACVVGEEAPVLARRGPVTPPRDRAERRLVEIWERVLGLEGIGVEDDFFDLGGRSLRAIELFAGIEAAFGVRLPLASLFEAPTVAAQARLLQRGVPARSVHRHLVPMQPEGTRPPLFCVHNLGSTVLLYAGLARHLGPDQPVYGVRGQGLEGERITFRSVAEMAEVYVDEMRSVQPEGPYHLLSFCLGSRLALAMAKRLRDEGARVGLLAFIDGVSPTLAPGGASARRAAVYGGHLSAQASQGAEAAGGRVRAWMGGLWERRRWLEARARLALGQSPPERLKFAYIMETNRRLLRAYAGAPYPGRIVVFRSERLRHLPPDLGWSAFARGGVETHDVAGPHRLLDEPYVRDLAALLRRHLETPEERGGSDRRA
ncbi:condensation domain-containing protein [Rhodocaloribacter sp.]